MMSCFAAAALATGVTLSCPGASVWYLFATTREFERFCPSEVSQAMGGPMGTRFDDAIAEARRREVEFTKRHRPALTAPDIEQRFVSFETVIGRQISEAHKTRGCNETARRLGLVGLKQPATPDGMMRVVRAQVLPSTLRDERIPEVDRIGTKMAYGLQGAVYQVLLSTYGCDRASLKAELLESKEQTANDAPPYVEPIISAKEKWVGTCKTNSQEFVITYRQDQRRWFTYDIETKNAPAPTAAQAAPVPAKAVVSPILQRPAPEIAPSPIKATTPRQSGFVQLN
jgi:hypothetical protein